MANIIFLDIDGPVIPYSACIAKNMARSAGAQFRGAAAQFLERYENAPQQANPLCVVFLGILATQTNSKFVISSTYRHGGFEKFSEHFAEWGFDADLLHDDWRTKSLQRAKGVNERSDEIREYISRHPEIEAFVTVDDEPLDFENHIQVCPQNGFSMDNYRQAFETLTGEQAKPTKNTYWESYPIYLGPPEIPANNSDVQGSIDRTTARLAKIQKRYEP